MADRLRFQFIREARLGQVGEIAVDVLDPTNIEEVKGKLSAREFAEFLVQNQAFDEEVWNFQPINDEPENDNNVEAVEAIDENA